MPNDNVLIHFMDNLAPELLFTIGILVILAYIAVKAIPILKDLRIASIDADKECKLKQLDFEERQAKIKADDAANATRVTQEQNKVIAQQNNILSSLVRTNDAVQVQLATLNTSLIDSKKRSQDMGDTVEQICSDVKDIKEKSKETCSKVDELHSSMIRQERLPISL